MSHSFRQAKVNESTIDRNKEHVLCIYYKDDSRSDELATRNEQEYEVKFRYWKSDEDTHKGKYSTEFLDNISGKNKEYFIKEN